jgi:anti-sigma regulatory factor (Ser/Thr protein kinase)
MQEISLHIMDIVENSITAGANRITVSVRVYEQRKTLSVTVNDNGTGMDEQMLACVTSPFTTTRTTRKIGMGIPLFKAGAEAAGGSFQIDSKPGKGTVVHAVYVLGHIDRPPLGNLADTFSSLALSNPKIDFVFEVCRDDSKFTCDMAQVKETLGGVPLSTPEVSLWLIEYLSEGIDEIFGGRF